MKEKKVKDERLVQLTNRILKETYLLMAGLLVISVLVKTYGLKLPYTQSIPELIILLVSCLYVAVRSMFLGGDLADTSKQGKRLTILAALGLSLVVAILNGARNYAAYGDQYRGLLDPHFLSVLAATFLGCLVLVSAGLYGIYYCHKKGKQRTEKQLETAEQKDETL